MSTRPPRPKSPKAATPEELRAWHRELKAYEAALQKWDNHLKEVEMSLTELEDQLLDGEIAESRHTCGSDSCDCDLEEENEYFCGYCTNVHNGRPMPGDPCYNKWREQQVEHTAKPMIQEEKVTEGELAWLEALYRLPDRRRKKK